MEFFIRTANYIRASQELFFEKTKMKLVVVMSVVNWWKTSRS